MDKQRIIHDFLMENRPDGSVHEVASCPQCKQTASELEEDVSSTEKLFTEEQHEALVASAVEKAIAEAAKANDVEILALNEKLVAAEEIIAERVAEIGAFEAAVAAREEADRLSAMADDRASLVKAVANFSDEQIEQRRMSWAKMDEEDFNAYLEDIKVVASTSKSADEDLSKTKFDGTRETAGESGTEKGIIAAFLKTGLVNELAGGR